MMQRTKILVFGLSLVTLVTVRCISEKTFTLQDSSERNGSETQTQSKATEVEALFGTEALGSTYYAINPDYSCVQNGEKLPSWEDSLYISPEGKFFLKGDRCSKTEIEITDLSTVSAIANGVAVAYRTHIYDRLSSIPQNDPGLNHQKYTESYCTLDHESMPNNAGVLKTDLHFHVYNSGVPNSASYNVGTGETPKEWSLKTPSKPLVSRTITERVLLYQFNSEYSAYVSLPGAIINHTALFTAYDSRHVTGTGRGQCFLNALNIPQLFAATGEKISLVGVAPRW